ncbi:MAG TPA: GAF domain-containing protein, partial [Candidatus Limnocylindrales bacterium]
MTTTVRAPKPKAPKADVPKATSNRRRAPANASKAPALASELEARLAILDEIGQAMAAQADFDSMVELVGNRLTEIFKATDFYIALYDRPSNVVSFPYELDNGERVHGEPIEFGQGLTSTIITTRRPLRLNTQKEQDEQGGFMAVYAEGHRENATQSWLGAPIVAGTDAVGVIAIGDRTANRYTAGDEALFSTIGATLGVSLRNAQLLAETTQRNAELAVINEIGEALAKQQDFASITEAVGERIRSIFNVSTVVIAELDEGTQEFIPHYAVDQGERLDVPRGPVRGLSGEVIRTRKPLRLGTLEEAEDHGAAQVGTKFDAESWLGVPVFAGDRIYGVIFIDRMPRYAFSDADERLLATIASNMGVALENARLFDETKHLLTETEQRASELAIINEIGSALAEQLDFQAIIELVGDRLTAMFDAESLYIAMYDRSSNLITYPYEIEMGNRLHRDPVDFGSGLATRVLTDGQSLRFGTVKEQAESAPFFVQPTYQEDAEELGPLSESWLGVPIFAGKLAIGVVVLGDNARDKYTEADERLVSTVASSMGVALENARLFDETKHLLTETEQRNAELAVINEISEALARQLDFQAIIDAVGEKISQIFTVTTAGISLFDAHSEMFEMRYITNQGQRLAQPPRAPINGLTRPMVMEKRAVRLGTTAESDAMGAVVYGTNEAESFLGVPILAGDRALGVITIERNPKNAFDEADERLLTTIASSLGVALENARLFDETKHLLAETDARAGELAIINEIGSALAEKLDFQAIIELVGERVGDILGNPDVSIALYDPARNKVAIAYSVEDG